MSVDSYKSRNSDVDFSDVFGGPPRRSSTQDICYNERSSSDFHEEEGEAEVSRSSSWFTFREKPVFGDETEERRRYPSEDFFDDVFRGDQSGSMSCSQSPRVVPRRNPFSSSPHSGSMSPARALPPSEAPVSPELPSLPSRLKSTSPSVSQGYFTRSPSRFKRPIRNQDEGAHTYYDMSSNDSTDGKQSTGTSIGRVIDQSRQKGSMSSNDGADIHFSIYKWVNNGVPIIFSLRERRPTLQEEIKLKRCNDGEEGAMKDTLVNENSKVDRISLSVCDPPMRVDLESPPKIVKTTRVSLSSFLQESKEGNKSTITNKRRKEKKIQEEGKQYHNNASFPTSNKTKVNKYVSGLKNDVQKPDITVTGAYKNVVENISKESNSKTTRDKKGQVHYKYMDNINTAYEGEHFPTRLNNEKQTSSHNLDEVWQDITELVEETSFTLDEQQFRTVDGGTIPTTVNPTSFSGSNDHSVNSSATNVNRTSDAMSKEMLEDITILSEIEPQDDTQGSQAKVSQWAKGKEQNIRALLSTLQLVLWENSGWKPIALVDIIDANGVKKAYQKALLRLHPDKLQQKGATSHQKFIAEKVFDILQEAWDHFNSLGQF